MKQNNVAKIDRLLNDLEAFFVQEFYNCVKVIGDTHIYKPYAHIRYATSHSVNTFKFGRVTTALKQEDNKLYLTVPRSKPRDYTIWAEVDTLIAISKQNKKYRVIIIDAPLLVSYLKQVIKDKEAITLTDGNTIEFNNFWQDSTINIENLYKMGVIINDYMVDLYNYNCMEINNLQKLSLVNQTEYRLRWPEYKLTHFSDRRKKIVAINIETLEAKVFDSLVAASLNLDIDKNLISHVITGRQKTAKNKNKESYTFLTEAQLEEFKKLSKENRILYIKNLKKNKEKA